jgi:hypothetical protein
MEGLEATGAFAEMLARQEEATDDGMYRSSLNGRYIRREDRTMGQEPAPPAVATTARQPSQGGPR